MDSKQRYLWGLANEGSFRDIQFNGFFNHFKNISCTGSLSLRTQTETYRKLKTGIGSNRS